MSDFNAQTKIELTVQDLETRYVSRQAYDELRARIAELERERDALQKNLSSTEAFYVAAKERAEQAEAEARELAGYAFISFPADAHYVPAEQMKNILHLCEKYLK